LCKQFGIQPDWSTSHMNGGYLPLNPLGAMEVPPRTARPCFPSLDVFEYMRSYPKSQPSKGDTVERWCL
jgi:hypothetical protein